MKAEKKGVTAVSAIIVILVVAALILVPLLKHNSVSGYMKDELQNVDNVSLISRCSEVEGKKNSVAGISVKYEEDMLKKLSVLVDEMDTATKELEVALVKYNTIKDITEASEAIRDDVLPKMSVLRIACDEAETITAESYWPFPTYGDLLFGVK